ncbi:MAG: transporter [Longimicrobiales bacterium]
MPRSCARSVLVAFVVTAATAVAAAAQESPTIASDRPGVGDGAWVLGPGLLQVEAGVAVRSTEGFGTGVALGQGLVRLGLPSFEVRLYPNSLVVGGAGEGLEDLGVGVKVPLRGGDRRISLIAGATIPTGSDEAGSDDASLFATGVWEFPVTDQVGLNVNAGYGFPVDDVADGQVLLTITPGVVLDEANGLSAYGGLAASLGDSDDVLLEAGLARTIDADTQVDLNVGLSLHDGTSFIGVGVSRRWR